MRHVRFQYFIFFSLLCSHLPAYAQIDASSITVSISGNEKYSVESAKKDLEKGTARLAVVCGTSFVHREHQDRLFKEKYGIGFSVMGDVVDGSLKEMKRYNYTIFKWLDDKYGKEWINEIRTDVVGFDKWVLYQDGIPYVLCETKPTFNGGTFSDFTVWVINHMEVEEQYIISGSVLLRALLSEDGDIIDVDDIGRLSYSPLTDAFIQAMMNAPKWTPAYNKGVPCKVILNIHVNIDYR